MLSALNRVIAVILFVIAGALFVFAVIFGFFAWINDGPVAGMGVFGTAGAFAAGLTLAGAALRYAAAAHARRAPARWWIQAAAVAAAYFAFGLALWTTSLLEDFARG